MINACIIGCGHISGKHTSAIKSYGRANLVAAADTNESVINDFAIRNSCRAYLDYKEMVLCEKPQVVHICTPHYLHAEMAIFCLEHGANIVIEKPMATSRQDAIAIIHTQKKCGKKASVIYQNRFNESVIIARSVIVEKKYGNIIGAKAIITWCRNEDYYKSTPWRANLDQSGGGVLMNQAIHTVDLLLYLIGEIESVLCRTQNFFYDSIEVEDSAEVVMHFKTGQRGILFATVGNVKNDLVEIEIYLERATLTFKGNNLDVSINESQEALHLSKDKAGGENSYYGDGHQKQIELFYDSLYTDSNIVTPEDALKSLDVILRAYESANFSFHHELPKKTYI